MAMILLTIAAALAALALLVPTISDLWSAVIAAARRRPPRLRGVPNPAPRFLFLVPAHNEELLIAACVRSLREQRYPRDAIEVVVVADNCDDETAQRAAGAGATVMVRIDPLSPGKPRALAWAIERIALDRFDAVAVIDADTVVEPRFAAALSAEAPLGEKAVQGYNGVANPDDNAMTRMAAVFADAKCRFAYGLKERAGLNLPIRLGGCIGARVLARHGWDAFSIGEDWELYALLTIRGVAIEAAPDARVYAQEARSFRQSGPQRQRWAAGKLTVLHTLWRKILSAPDASWHQKLDLLSELSAPGPVVHLGIASAIAGALLALRAPGAVSVAVILAAGVARHVGYAFAAVLVQQRPWRTLAAFAFLPVYFLWRIPTEFLALRMLGNKPWLRTERHAAP